MADGKDILGISAHADFSDMYRELTTLIEKFRESASRVSELKEELRGLAQSGASADILIKKTQELADAQTKASQGALSALDANSKYWTTLNAAGKDVSEVQRAHAELNRSYKELSEGARESKAVIDKYSKSVTDSSTKTEEAGKKIRSESQKTASEVKEQTEGMSNALENIKNKILGLVAVWSAKEFANKVVEVRGQFQQLEVAFTTMLGSETQAMELMSQLTETAASTPFDLQGVTQGAKQLLAYGIEAEKVNDTLIHLGDIAAGLSLPLNDLVYLYGTTMTQGRMFTQDLRQFMGRGIPIAEELAKQFGVTKDKVGELVSAGKVGAEEFNKAIMAMSSEGGKFAGLMEAQSKTISGQISNIEDAIDNMFNEIGKQSEGIINGTLGTISSLVENYERVGRVLMGLVTTYGLYKAAIITVSAIEKVAAAQKALEVAATTASTGAKVAETAATTTLSAAEMVHYGRIMLVQKAQALLNATMLANPYVLVAVAIGGVVTALLSMKTEQERVNDALEAYNREKEEAIAKEQEHQREIEELVRIAGDESYSTDARRTALIRLENKYPDIFAKYDTEKEKLAHILEIKQKIAELDGQTSRTNNNNELERVNRRIQELEKLGETKYMTMNGQTYQAGGRSQSQNDELKMLRGERQKLQREIKKSSDIEYQKNLSSLSESELKAQKAQRERLIALMESNPSKKVGRTTNGIIGEYTLQELKSQRNQYEAELNRRNEVTRAKNQDFNKENQKVLQSAKDRLNEWKKLSNPNERAKSTETIDGKKISDLTKDEWQEELKKREQAVKDAQKTVGAKNSKGGQQITTSSAALDEVIRKNKIDREKAERDMESEIADARIDAMRDGEEKAKQERERAFQKEKEQLEERRKRAIEEERNRQKAEHDAREKVNKAQGGKITPWDDSMTDTSKIDAINKQFDELQEISVKKRQEDELRLELQSMRDYLKEYGTFQQKKLAIAEEYAEKIREAEASGNKWEVKRLEAERDREIGGAKANELAQGIDFTQLVSGVGDVVRKIGEETYKKIQEYKTTDEYKQSSAESKKSIAELESQVVDVGGAGSINLFSPSTWESITIATKNYNDALEEQRQRYEEERLAIEEQKKATREYEEALKALNNETDVAKKIPLALKAEEARDKKETADKNAETASSNKKDADNKVTTTGTQVTTSLTRVNRELGNFNTALSQITSGSLKGFADGLTNLISGGKKTSLAELGKGGGIVGLILTIIDMLGDNPSEAIAGIIDGILKCVDAIIEQLLNGDLISTLVTHIATGIAKIFQSLFEGLMNISTFGLFSFGGKDNHQEMLDVQAKLTKSIESTTAALNKMTQELERSYGAVAMAYGDKAEELIRKNLESIVKGIDSVLTDNYGGGHSDYYHLNKNQDLLRQIEEYGREYGIKAGNGNGYAWQELLANNSPENLAKLFKTIRDSGDDLWRIITQESGYNEGALQEWIEKLIDTYDQFDENAEQLAEQLTTTTKENVFDDFLENLYNMADGSETVFEDIADDWQKMVNRMTINNLVSENYKKKLEDWYKSLAELNKEKSKANTTMTDEEYKIQLDKLKQEYENFALDAKRDIEQLKEVGIIAPTEGNTSEEQSTYNSLEKWTYEQADELISRATAMQIIQEHIYEALAGRSEYQIAMQSTIGNISLGVGSINEGIAATIELHTATNSKLDKIISNTAPISDILETVRKIYKENN